METRPDNLAETATYHLREISGRGTCVKHVFVNHVHPKRAARLRGKSPGGVGAGRPARRSSGGSGARPTVPGSGASMLPRDARARRGPRGAVAADGDDRGDVLAVAEMAGQHLALSPRVGGIGVMHGHGDREPGGLDQDGRSGRTAWSPRSPASVNSRVRTPSPHGLSQSWSPPRAASACGGACSGASTGRQSGQGVWAPVMPLQRRFGWRAAVASSSRRTGAE